MPKKLTILGALTAALLLGLLGLFNGSSTSHGAIQSFSTASFSWTTCYGGAYPVPAGAGVACGAGSSETAVPRDTSLVSYSLIELPPGLRISLPITYTPGGAETLANGAIGAGDVTINVDSTTGFPATGRLQIQAEEVDYAGITATSFTGVTRGVDATAAAAHADNTLVKGATEFQADAVTCAAPATNNECDTPGPNASGWTAGTPALAGDVTARTDILCDATNDILADGHVVPQPPGGAADSQWPDNAGPLVPYWEPAKFYRTSASAQLGGFGPPVAPSDNAYVVSIVPFPTSGVNAFDFNSIDTSILTDLYLGGTAPLDLSLVGGFVKLQLASYSSNYPLQNGLSSSVALLAGEPTNPPSDSFTLCLDSPQDSVGTVSYLKTPDADRVIPRWNTTISAADLQGGEIDAIMSWQCVVVGAGEPDTDGDCLPNAAEPLAASCTGGVNDKDCDNDLVPDGIEAEMGSSPNDLDGDTDGDGASDYDELFNFTNPAPGATDSDGDGQADKRDDTPTNGTAAASDAPGTGTDAAGAAPNGVLDDNCPAVSNADQRNSDSMWRFHGAPPSFAPGVPQGGTGDRSNPDEDMQGDLCDTDDDNDEINDVSESLVLIGPWSGFTDPGGACTPYPGCGTSGDFAATSVCAGPDAAGFGAILSDYVDTYAEDGADYSGHLNPLLGDSDLDYFLDGRECALRSRPDQSIRDNVLAENCNAAPTVPLDNGCAQPGGPTIGGANDGEAPSDQLYLPGGGAASHPVIEKFFRTTDVTTAPLTQDDDYDFPQTCAAPVGVLGDDGNIGSNDRDSDRDFICPALGAGAALLIDGVEVRVYGTNPNTYDTDQDNCPDAEEVMDLNGDYATSSIDQGVLASKLPLGNLDNNGDGKLDDYVQGANFDMNKDGAMTAADQGFLATGLSSSVGGNCSALGVEDNVDIGKATAGLP